MIKPFVPKVTHTKNLLSAPVLAWAQAQADAAYARTRFGEDGLETEAVEICASDRPVAPHADAEGKEDQVRGMRIYGLVIRSDGHRLHSDNLHAAGVIEGLPLAPGDVYEIDVFDRHWTTVPDDAGAKPQVIFTVSIMHPDGRNHAKLGHDFMWTVLAASIDAMKRERAA